MVSHNSFPLICLFVRLMADRTTLSICLPSNLQKQPQWMLGCSYKGRKEELTVVLQAQLVRVQSGATILLCRQYRNKILKGRVNKQIISCKFYYFGCKTSTQLN